MAIKSLYTAHAVATEGRNGNTKTYDGLINLNLPIPKAMGEKQNLVRIASCYPHSIKIENYTAFQSVRNTIHTLSFEIIISFDKKQIISKINTNNKVS